MPFLIEEPETEETKRMKVKIDPETGLPVVPDDMFWRVGEVEETIYTGYSLRRQYVKIAAVQLMQTGQEVKRTRKVPIYGGHWWNRNSVVSEREEVYTEIENVPVEEAKFKGLDGYKKDIPEIAVNVQLNYALTYGVAYSGNDIDEENEIYNYDIPMNEEGVAFLADVAWRTYMSWMYDSAVNEEKVRKAKALKAEEKANQERLFGDYPPKKLAR